MTSKQRSYLKGLAMTMDAVLQIGKSSLTPEITKSVEEALNARELIKIHVLKNCADDGKDLAQILAERTHSEVVQVIGKMIVLYKPAKEEKRESGREENPAGLSRRSFLSLTGIFAAHTALRAQEKLTDGGLAVIEQKKIPRRATPIVPAGAASLRNMAHHCTGCQLCVAVCPNGVLRPSEKLTSLMQPEMSYERGYCRPECTKCSEVCPAGAILPVTAAEKSSVQIGHAVWIRANCVPLTDGVDCGNCARHCPSEAITMVPSDTADPDSPKIPVVNTERCIGCGACENLCPARPFSAIYVEGHERHRTI